MGPRKLLLGLRLRGAAFLNRDPDEDPDPGRADPGTGGLGSLTLALRVRPLGDGRGRRAPGGCGWKSLVAVV